MKRLFVFFLIVLCLVFGACAKEEDVYSFCEINGVFFQRMQEFQKQHSEKVEVKYDVDASGCFIAKHEICYDEQGRIRQWNSYDSEGENYLSKEYQYGEHTIETIRRNKNTDIKIIDENNNVLKCISFADENQSIEILYDSQNREVKRIKYDENGNVISLYEYKYENVSDAYIVDKTFEDGYGTYIYDEKGNLISFNCFVNNKEKRGQYQYNAQNQYTEIVRVFGDIMEREEYGYDESGNCIFKIEYRENAVCALTEYQYDEAGNCILKIYYDILENQNTKTYTHYTPEGKLAQIQYFENDEPCGYVQYLYTENTQTVVRYNGDGQIVSKDVYEYDDMGREIKFSFYGYKGDDLIWWRETDYYPNGDFAKSIGYYENGEERSHSYRDSFGNMVSFSSGPNDPFVSNIG